MRQGPPCEEEPFGDREGKRLWKNGLRGKYGLHAWPEKAARYWYFLPMIVLATGNLWGGVQLAYSGFAQVLAVLSMLLIGFVEEVLFRGFLFKALLKKDGEKAAIIVSAVTFGIGHIVNLLNGKALGETLFQIVFAVALGFVLVILFHRTGSLIPCILFHSFNNALNTFTVEGAVSPRTELLINAGLILLLLLYLFYLLRALPEPKEE